MITAPTGRTNSRIIRRGCTVLTRTAFTVRNVISKPLERITFKDIRDCGIEGSYKGNNGYKTMETSEVKYGERKIIK